MKLQIGLSFVKKNDSHYYNYEKALRHAADVLGYELEVSDLGDHPELIDKIDAIVFTGGADVNPNRYGKPELLPECKIEEKRDSIEFDLAKKADERNLPIFGICRGLQLLNVHYGGTLIADISDSEKVIHTKDTEDKIHEVHVEPGKLVKKISRVSDAQVTSAHHQAIDLLAPGMVISAKSSGDDIIEAIEWQDQTSKPYFLAVQWHPERMDFDQPLSGKLFENFLENVAMRKFLMQRMK